MMHNSTSHWGQYKPDLGQAKVTTTLLFTGWRGSSLHHKQILCPSQGFLRSVTQGFWSQGHNRIHTVQEGSHTRTTNHCKNYCILSKNLSPTVARRICHLVTIRIGMNKMAKGDEHLDYHDETLEWMAKPWSVSLGAFLETKWWV